MLEMNPVSSEPPPPAIPATEPVPWHDRTDKRRHNVLVVDDDEGFASAVADALNDRDIKAVPVADPREALALARRTPFAAAVVDLVMPGMDGLELARELRRANPTTEVVMLTGHGDMHSAVEGIRNELSDYLQKSPTLSAPLRRAVRAAIARSQLQAENGRLKADLHESSRKLNALNEISDRLSAERHLDGLLDELVTGAKDLLEAETGRVLLLERNDLGDMTIRVVAGDGEAVLGGHFGPGDGIAARVAESREPVRVDVPHDHPSYSFRCDDMGTSLPGFIAVPLAGPTLSGVLVVAGRARPFSDGDTALLASLARQGAVAVESIQNREIHENFFTHVSEMLVSLLDSQDVHSQGHSHKVAALADMVTRGMDLPEEERRTIHFAALLHDIGKLRLAPGILAPTHRLTEDEMRAEREHPSLALDILRPVSKWAALPPIIHTHHERWDGHGYPRGLEGDEIPLGGRVVAVAEAFEAMTSPQPDRSPMTVNQALAEIEACAGSHFDPEVARVFVEGFRHNRDRFQGTV